MEAIKICGKTFTRNQNIYRDENGTCLIDKMRLQLKNWDKRNFSTDGQILVAKIFGLSQIVYLMQNMAFTQAEMKIIERDLFKFMWKGPEKVKRSLLQLDYKVKGTKAPNITWLDIVDEPVQTSGDTEIRDRYLQGIY